MLLLLVILLQTIPLQEYGDRASKLSPDDAKAHYQLGLWCGKKGLEREAKVEFQKSVLADPGYVPPRRELSHQKIGSTWVAPGILESVSEGIRFPSEEETERMRERGRLYARVIDVFWKKENWAVALSRIRDLTGLYTGTLEIEVRFGRLDSIPAMGGGIGGRGTITLDLDQLVAYEKTIDEFARKVAAGGKVVVPPAATPAIITHELVHCFQGTGAPSWFLEGMAAYCAGDSHFVHFFRHRKQEVGDIDEPVARKYVYARGWGFFEWMRASFGPASFRRMLAGILTEGKPVSQVVEELSGRKWSELKTEEKAYTRRWIESCE